MKIALASDHEGFELKQAIKLRLERVHEVMDLGTRGKRAVDYPDFARRVAIRVARGECERGILICGTGIGMSIAANKFPGIRAALCRTQRDAELSRRHNDANVLVLPSMKPSFALRLVDIWLRTGFEGGRHERRLRKIREIEERMGLG
jgi:ribose 5-phosphate isomerase B